jgi:hypothetical protein
VVFLEREGDAYVSGLVTFYELDEPTDTVDAEDIAPCGGP